MTRDEAIEILRCWKDGDAAEALEVVLKVAEEQPCEDAVSKKAVKDFLMSEGIYGYDKRIDELPSVQSESRWIPVSERLPKGNDRKWR